VEAAEMTEKKVGAIGYELTFSIFRLPRAGPERMLLSTEAAAERSIRQEKGETMLFGFSDIFRRPLDMPEIVIHPCSGMNSFDA